MKNADSVKENLFSLFDKIFPYESLGLEAENTEIGIEHFFNIFLSSFNSSLKASVPVLSGLFAICTIVAAFSYFTFDERKMALVENAVLTVSSISIYSLISPIVLLVQGSLSDLLDFVSSLAPVFSAVMLAYGNTNSAVFESLNMNLVTSAVSFVLNNLLMPLSLASFAFAMISSFSEGAAPKVNKTIKTVFFTALGTVSTLLFSSLSLQGVLASAKDGVYVRTAKQMMSGMVPVVGGTLSASLSSLIAAFGYVKGVMGTLSVAFILSLFLPTLFSLLFLRLALSFALSFMEFASMGGGVRVFSAFISGIDTLLALFVASFLCSIFGVVFFIKGGASLFG
jgi:hypothetical protein